MMQREGDVRIPSGCAIAGVISRDGGNIPGDLIVKSMATMHAQIEKRIRRRRLCGSTEHTPQYKVSDNALHIFYDTIEAREACEKYLNRVFEVVNLSKIPIRKSPKITNEPLIWRYFVTPHHNRLADSQLDEKEYVVKAVIHINTHLTGAYVFSSGKNMGVFKAVGYPEDVGAFYRLEEYEGYSWTAHGRYPTNTPGWWGGAHPFAMLDYSIVHNGEISSYDANRRFIEMYGYKCTLLTDTEVITYIVDFLLRRRKLTLEETAHVIAAPFWSTIAGKSEEERKRYTYLEKRIQQPADHGPLFDPARL